MLNKHLALTLLLVFTTLNLAFPSNATAQSDKEIEKVRAQVQLLSPAKDSQVEVKFRDKTKLKGYITSVSPGSFTLTDPKTGTSQSISYSEVNSVAKASSGVSKKTWFILGGVAAGVVTTWLIVKPAFCDGGAVTRGIC